MTNLIIRDLKTIDFADSWQQMQSLTQNRTEDTLDEFWVLEHQPVFTLGLAGKHEHLLFKNHNIPIVQCDRGGQVTYHGPGQIIVYMLVDIRRAKLNIRCLVDKMEQGVINYLASFGIVATNRRDAPGVYVDGKKIASLGLKVKKGCTYHGLSFNFAMDLKPFSYINVCGYSGLQVTQLQELVSRDKLPTLEKAKQQLCQSVANSIFDDVSCMWQHGENS